VRRAKILATLGPASREPGQIEALMAAGAVAGADAKVGGSFLA
jgi:pyruvate kinase